MLRKIIKIDEDKCVGCGLCANACHEGAIAIVNGKAKLLRDDYCDGLGNCLPVCPTRAITFEERDTEVYNKEVAPKRVDAKPQHQKFGGCPGSQPQNLAALHQDETQGSLDVPTLLYQWPVQLKLVPITASYFENANLLIAADCSAYAYGNFHNDFMKNRITLIGCPKLDECEYSEKLTAILKENHIKSITVVKMEVPCCGGLEDAVKTALRRCEKLIQWKVITLSPDGRILEE